MKGFINFLCELLTNIAIFLAVIALAAIVHNWDAVTASIATWTYVAH